MPRTMSVLARLAVGAILVSACGSSISPRPSERAGRCDAQRRGQRHASDAHPSDGNPSAV